MDRSRGGRGTTIHVVLDALGNPCRILLSEAQKADISMAEELIEGLSTAAVIADKGYDSNDFIATIQQQGAEAVIPSRSNRKEQRVIDENLYKDRNKVERWFNRLKQCRRVATRYEKTARNYLAVVQFAASLILLL